MSRIDIWEVNGTVHGRSKKEEYKSYITQSNFSNLSQTPVSLETINRGDHARYVLGLIAQTSFLKRREQLASRGSQPAIYIFATGTKKGGSQILLNSFGSDIFDRALLNSTMGERVLFMLFVPKSVPRVLCPAGIDRDAIQFQVWTSGLAGWLTMVQMTSISCDNW